jgi:hypothetical protein
MCSAVTSVSRNHRYASVATEDPYSLTVLGSQIVDGYLCLQYSVSPVPAPLAGDGTLHEGGDAGLAVDSRHRVYRKCRSAYRTARDGDRVVGALKIGPADWPRLGVVRVLFAPFAHTPEICYGLRAVRMTVDADRVRSITVDPI